MSSSPLLALIARCRTLGRPRSQSADAELLARFAHHRDAAAFEELLERYAPLVWSVCRRIAFTEADAEDAFQAAFLALVRQAGRLDDRQPLGGWLHTVAVRVARRGRSLRQRHRPNLSERATHGDVADEIGSGELMRTVDEEIDRLPKLLRAPLLLCCLQGRTRDEAAQTLACSVAAVKSRLERGRNLLRVRLESRGVQLPAAFLVLGLTGQRIRAALWAKTMQSALHTPAAMIVALSEAALPVLTVGKCKLILAAMLLAASAAGMAGAMLMPKAEEVSETVEQAKPAAEPKKPHAPQVRTDRHGDPLPDGAIARLGTVRWRHGDFVHSLAYSPDGKMIVTSGVGRALVLWDAATGKELRVFPNLGQPRGVAFSPDGKSIATTHRKGQIWDTASGKMLRELKNPQLVKVVALAYAPDGKILATVNSDGFVHLWDPSNGEEKRRINCEQGYLSAVAYSPDGKMLASAGSYGTIRLWNPVTGKEARRITTDKRPIWSVVFSADGKQLAVGRDEDSPRLWDAATGREIRSFGEKQGQFAPLAFSPDGKQLAAGYPDGTFRLWDAGSGEEKRHWHAGAGLARSLAFSPDGKTLATAVLWDGGIRLWDVATGSERNAVEGHHGPNTLLRFTADKATLISAGIDRCLLGWDVATQTPRRRFAWTTESFASIALSPDDDILAVSDHKTHEVWLWDIRTGKSKKLPGKHRNLIQTIAFSPDGRLVASGGRDDSIHVWDVREGKEIRRIESNLSHVGSLCFSPDGTALAFAMGQVGNAKGKPTLRLWDLAGGKERCSFDIHNVVDQLAFSPDGKVLASGDGYEQAGKETLVRLWDTATGKELCRHGGHREGIGAVAFSADGKLVASGAVDAEDSSIHIWEAATGRLIRRFEGHHSWVFAVTFAADGMTVASSAGDSTILLWDITGRRSDGRWHVKPLTPHQLEACWAALTNEDAAKAYDAVWAFVAAPEQVVPFLQKHLPPLPRADAKTVARLIAELDSDNFTARQKAAEELNKLGDAIAPALRRALDGKPSLEVRRRLQQLLDRTRDWSPERLRDHRAIQALEHIGTRQAKEMLQTLTEGAPASSRTEEAKAAFQRLGRSPAPKKN